MADRQPAAAQPVTDQKSRVLGKAAIRAAELLGITNATLGTILGLSAASVSRLKAGSYPLRAGSKEYELAQLFVRLFRGLDAITGGDSAALRSWLTGENLALRKRPIDLIQKVDGLVQAVWYVDSRRARL